MSKEKKQKEEEGNIIPKSLDAAEGERAIIERQRLIKKYDMDPSLLNESWVFPVFHMIEEILMGVSTSKKRKGAKQAVKRLEDIAKQMGRGWPSEKEFNDNYHKLWAEVGNIGAKYEAIPSWLRFDQPIEKPVSTYRMSKPLNRETTLNPKARAEQLDMFIELEAEYKEALALGDPITEKTFLPWVDLEPSEHALIDTFYVLLWKKSETQKKELESYYMGNVEPETGKPSVPAFSFSEYELATTFYGGGDIGGKNVRAVVDIAERLANKHFGMREYKPVRTRDGQTRRWEVIVRYKPLFCFIEVENSGGR